MRAQFYAKSFQILKFRNFDARLSLGQGYGKGCSFSVLASIADGASMSIDDLLDD
jgi:hypothetical protein